MGFFDFFRRMTGARNPVGFTGESPSTKYPEPLDLLTGTLEKLDAFPELSAWTIFTANQVGRDPILIQVLGPYVNTCLEEVDMPATLRRAGLRHLEEKLKQASGTLYQFEVTSAERAQIVDAVYRFHFRLRPGYQVTAKIDA